MSESIAEMVIPGSYIEVRAEGLISVGGIPTGNIGIVGSAAKGPVNTPILLGSWADAVDVFGPYDSGQQATSGPVPLTLTRAIQLAFDNGASSIVAVRVGNGIPTRAQRALRDASSAAAFTLTAKEGGTYGNAITIGVVDAGTGRSKLTLAYRNQTETYEGTAREIQAAIKAESRLVDITDTPQAPTTALEAHAPVIALGATGNGNAAGDDKSSLTAIEFKAGLDLLVDKEINILLVANATASGNWVDLKGVIGAHLETTENLGRERIAILGARSSGTATDVSAVTAEASDVSNDRVVFVAPGLVYTDPGTRRPFNLPPSYLAAAVAGQLAAQASHISLTNKALAIDGVDVAYGAPATKALLGARALVVRPKFGFQVVKGITTDPGPFKQISVRRTVDYAKAGVRLGADPYIGRLNNARVRAALKATLDGFLSQMVLDEMLTEYTLQVTATRSQEIAGICAVAMTLKPTFSIDYIRVTMTLE
jgi:Phage tail sheath C-terminal domain